MLFVFGLSLPALLAQTCKPSKPLLRCPAWVWPLVAIGVALQLAAGAGAISLRWAVPMSFGLGAMALTGTVWRSSSSIGLTTLAGVGALMNTIPIAVYGSMPVLRSSRQKISDVVSSEPTIAAAKHVEIADAPLLLHALSDWIVVPGVPAVFSVGDVVLLVVFAALGLRTWDRQPTPNDANNATEGSVSRRARWAPASA